MATTIEEVWIHALAARAGGGLTYFHEAVPRLVRVLLDRGVAVRVLTPNPAAVELLPEGTVEVPPTWATANAFGRLRYDQVALPRQLKGRPAALFSSGNFSPRSPTCRSVVLVRNTVYFDEEYLSRETSRRRMLRGLQRKLVVAGARAADVVHVPTQAMGDLLNTQSVDTEIRVNPYGVRAGLVRAAGGGPSGDPQRFLYVMNYTLQKNLGTLLHALALAKAEGLPVQVVLTSDLQRGPAACFRADRAIIDDHDLVESGHLELAGRVHGSALMDLYGSVDACVFPSITEAFGNPLVEALALGLPIIASDRSWAREICGAHAVYVDPLEPARLVDAWRDWATLRSRWAPMERADLERRFSWDRHVRQLADDLLG